jgi:hypothetical protein
MSSERNEHEITLKELLSEEPEAQARYAKLPAYQKEMCLRWVAEAQDPILREQRLHRLVRRLWLTAFDPMYDMADLALGELSDLYGPPQLLKRLSPEEQALAVREGRALGGNHTRNFDDAGTWFRAIPPDEEQPRDDFVLVFPRPCVLTKRAVEWINHNWWETNRDALDAIVSDPEPPAPGPPR